MTNTKPFALRAMPITLGWLYPELMSTYGDRGNVLVLQKRAEMRGITIEVLPITESTTTRELRTVDLIFGGGAQDLEQDIVMSDLKKGKGKVLKELIDNDVPALFVCGSPQLMGNFYEPAQGKRIDGVGIFDIETTHPGELDDRIIGNAAGEIIWENLNQTIKPTFNQKTVLIGFENHGGRTILGKEAKPLAQVIIGKGNNGTDGTEGVVYRNAIGCYYHGPVLPKNPILADWLLTKALEVKYKTEIFLEPLDDSLAFQAREAIAKKLGLSI